MSAKEKKTVFSGHRQIAVIGILVLLALVIGACTTETSVPTDPTPIIQIEKETVVVIVTAKPPTDVPPTPTEPPPEPTPLPDHSEIIAAWEDSVHGNTYDEGKGPNTWCSRCHSPQNWDPEAFRGPPPSCFTCKFPTDDEIRIAEGNPLVPEDEWVGITCETCHRTEMEVVTEEIAWFNPIKMEYEDVNTSTELCEKCHVTTSGNSFGSAVDHKITLGGSAHLNYGGFLGEERPPTYCADCHDPHTQIPQQCEDCHEDVLTLDTHMMSFTDEHAIVTCMACHDASGLEVGPHPDEEMDGIWVTQLTTVGRSGPSTSYVKSHSLQWEVACDRCHFEENPWELTVFTADGEIPEPPEDEGEGGGDG